MTSVRVRGGATRSLMVLVVALGALLASSCIYYPAALQHEQNDPSTRPWWCDSTGNAGGASAFLYPGVTKGQLTWDDCEKLSAQFDLALQYGQQYPTAGDATANGFHKVVDYVTGLGAQYVAADAITPADLTAPGFDPLDPVIPGSPLDGTFDQSTPELLSYDGNGPDANLVSVGWYVRTDNGQPPAGFPGNNDWWQVHPRLCLRTSDAVVVGEDLTDTDCTTAGGVNLHLDHYYMIHAWIVPGWEVQGDVFRDQHPCLKTAGPVTDAGDPCWNQAATPIDHTPTPLHVGGSRNFLGTFEMLQGGGANAGGTTAYSGWTNENFWSSVSGYCARREHGDRITPRTDANGGTTFDGCEPGVNGVIANPEYRNYGYYYGIEFKADLGTSATVQIYDGPDCQFASGYNVLGGDSGAASGAQGGYTFKLLDNDSLDPRASTVLAVRTLKPSDCASWMEQWKDLFTIPAPTTKGTYWLQVTPVVPADKTIQEGDNQFGLRIATGGTFTPCTNDPADVNYDSNINCPSLFAASDLGVYAALFGGPSSTSAFSVADVGPEQAGKYLDVELWDPAEGSQYLELLDPNGVPVTFTWEVACMDGTYRSENGGSCSTGENAPSSPDYGPGTSNKFDVSGTVGDANKPWGSLNSQNGKYSDRLLRLRYKLPDDINAAYSGKTWWKVRYTKGSAAGDRTTWSASVTAP